MANNLVDTLMGAVSDAPEAGFPALNFGKLEVEPLVVSWGGAKGSRIKNSVSLTPGKKLSASETLELKITVDIRDINPALEFVYERNVPVRKNSADGKTKTDWSMIVEPSLIAVFGKDWAAKVLKNPYVQVEDAPNFAGKASSTTGRVFGVPKFVAAYGTLSECVAAHDAIFGTREGAEVADSPNGIPSDIVVKAQALAQAIPQPDQLRQLLQMGEYAPYASQLEEMLIK